MDEFIDGLDYECAKQERAVRLVLYLASCAFVASLGVILYGWLG